MVRRGRAQKGVIVVGNAVGDRRARQHRGRGDRGLRRDAVDTDVGTAGGDVPSEGIGVSESIGGGLNDGTVSWSNGCGKYEKIVILGTDEITTSSICTDIVGCTWLSTSIECI